MFVLVQFEDPVLVILKQKFVTFSSNFSWRLQVYLTSLQTFFFLCISSLQTIYFVFSGLANNQFFSIFLIPALQKNNGPSLKKTNCNISIKLKRQKLEILVNIPAKIWLP